MIIPAEFPFLNMEFIGRNVIFILFNVIINRSKILPYQVNVFVVPRLNFVLHNADL